MHEDNLVAPYSASAAGDSPEPKVNSPRVRDALTGTPLLNSTWRKAKPVGSERKAPPHQGTEWSDRPPTSCRRACLLKYIPHALSYPPRMDLLAMIAEVRLADPCCSRPVCRHRFRASPRPAAGFRVGSTGGCPLHQPPVLSMDGTVPGSSPQKIPMLMHVSL